jgi:hypothetical protein
MRRIEFSAAPRADVALLKRNLEFWPVFREIVSGFSTIELETIGSPVNGRDVAPVVRDLFAKKATLGYASMAARFRKSGARVLLASDQTSQPISELGRLVPMMQQVLIAHGSHRRKHIHDPNRITGRENRVLCVWGQSDIDLQREASVDGVRCRAVGSLRNAGYLRLHPLREKRPTEHELLFISQYAGREEGHSSPTSKRNQVLLLLKSHLRRYCSENSLALTVALRPPISAPHAVNQQTEEKRHYQHLFAGVRLRFTDPTQLYASYRASDEADVTIGVPEGTLTESFGRGNKVLMFGESSAKTSHYEFPLDGPWLVREPIYEQFAERMDYLRGKSRVELAAEWQDARQYVLANAESDAPLAIVRDLISRCVSGEEL